MNNRFSFNLNGLQNLSEKIGKVDICDNQLFYRFTDRPLKEVNDDLTIIEPENSFWETIEYELKIDICQDVDMVSLLIDLSKVLQKQYSISKIDHKKSFEKHYEVVLDNQNLHVVKLGKKGWKLKKAIKTKAAYNGLGRKVSIQPYTEDKWNEVLKGCKSVKQYSPFYKDKYRIILVNRESGTVFGLSGSVAKFISKKYANKCEIEVEYWSSVLPDGQSHKFDLANEEELYDIINIAQKYLATNKIKYLFPGVRKSEWLKTLY